MSVIPVDILPAHVYLSQEDKEALFGSGYVMTVQREHSHQGQVVYEETVEVFGRLKRSLTVHVLGPEWEESHVEVSLTEAVYLGYNLDEVQKGDLNDAVPCRLAGPNGEVELEHGLTVPSPHLSVDVDDARVMNVHQGQRVQVELQLDKPVVLEDVLVRVHPSFERRLELHADYARKYWLFKQAYAKKI